MVLSSNLTSGVQGPSFSLKCVADRYLDATVYKLKLEL